MEIVTEKTFHLDVLTPDCTKLNEDVFSAVVPGVEGEMGLLAGHAPILALLAPGLMHVRTPLRTLHMAVGEGFIEMRANRAVCLVSFAETPEEVDVAAARRAETSLRQELTGKQTPEEREALRTRLREQTARIQVVAPLES